MTPEQAIELLDQAASQAALPRAHHIEVARAANLLRELIAKKPDPKKGKA